MKKLTYVLFGLAMLVWGLPTYYALTASNDTYVLTGATETAAAEETAPTFLSETNRHRAEIGLSPLAENAKLYNAALAKCHDMVSRDYFSHDTPDGQRPWIFIQKMGYQYQVVGENLAFGQQTQKQVVDAWMDSPGHRDNLLHPSYKEVGHAVCKSDNYTSLGEKFVVVQMLGEPR